ncbi:bifunctional oligoribonuclease/PAP phosphatase NrnA [bacterium]|nr:bifunctional oligoribonuclease/PAP phosphatase NrnA [bacterium]
MEPLDRLEPLKNEKKYEEFVDFLINTDNFLLTAHIRADGDAIAAVCFLHKVLRKLNKNVYSVLSDPEPDPKYHFLSGFEYIQSVKNVRSGFHQIGFVPRTAIILDSPTFERTGESASLIKSCPQQIFVDHHPGTETINHLNLVDISASSTCEILARLLPYLNIPITPDLAEILYTGISFDTGNFRFSNTSGSALLVASALVELGAKPEKINAAIFFSWSLLKVRIMAQVLQSITLYSNNRVSISHIPLAFFQSNPDVERDLEGFSDLGISMKGVRIAVFLREKESGMFKASLRATGKFDIGSVATQFGGGGHRKAAACQINGTYSEVVELLINSIQKFNPGLNRKHS